MSDSVYIGRNVSKITDTPTTPKYDKVIINIDEDSFVEYGNGNNALEISCPWGTQKMAKDIYESLSDFTYKPYDTDWVVLNPASELGDGVTINGIFSGIYNSETEYTKLITSKISAPQRQETVTEYKYKTPEERATKRRMSQIKASLRVNAESIEAEIANRESSESQIYAKLAVQQEQIEARVTSYGSNGNNSFSWQLTSDGFRLKSNSKTVFSADSGGVTIEGKIVATSGTIGGCSIENGILKIDNANIKSINADRITAGTLSVDRIEQNSIPAGKIVNSSITSEQIASGGIGGGSISTNAIANGHLQSGSVWGTTISGGAVNGDKLEKTLKDTISSSYNFITGLVEAQMTKTKQLVVNGTYVRWINVNGYMVLGK